MKCPHCQAEIADLSTFCVFCKKTITLSDLPKNADENVSAPVAMPTPATQFASSSNPYAATPNAASQPAAPAYSYAPPQQTAPQPGSQNNAQSNPYASASGAYSYGAPSTGNRYYVNSGYANPAYTNAGYVPNVVPNPGKSGGEIAAIVTAIVVSVLSFIVAFILFFYYVGKIAMKEAPDSFNLDDFSDISGEDYGIDGFDDEDSWEKFFDYYNSIIGDNSEHPASSPAPEHTPVRFKGYLTALTPADESSGSCYCQYDVEIDEAYRGDAALKLLEGATLPELDADTDIYLVRFKFSIAEQDSETYVELAPSIFTQAYAVNEDSSEGTSFSPLTRLEYKDKHQLIKKGDEAYGWMAFQMPKTEERPLIKWDMVENEYFRFSNAATSDAAGLEAGGALDNSNTDSTQN